MHAQLAKSLEHWLAKVILPSVFNPSQMAYREARWPHG